ncbi:thiamine-phosphate kinase [Agrococcus carbonis]|uniref:Thiamine-monophosphate kinase n=1 Tax=Agrococcus carbonis TaxID=684552 RepID=A0A1H1RY39_9MICO|nr:thiamine-phosphate kinase [Agrococcus carbonis]SDS40661.1 thiamine-phosphate kinase [Agrococcus carbonis]
MDDAAPHDPTLHEVGELEALRRFLPLLPAGDATDVGPGDDAAVVRAGDGRFVVTTDTMLEGADFRLGWSTWHDLGWKAVATNLIDVAAMGARPTSLVVALAVAPSTRVSALEGFARGLADAVAAMAPGCGVVGGDLGTAPHATVAVTAFGDLEGRAPVLRSGARATDAVWLVGRVGAAAAGLRHLFAQAQDEAAVPVAAAVERLRAGARGAVLEAQLAPVTPIGAGTLLADLGATAMLDVSDGLALDAARVARASGVRIALERAGVEAAAADVLADGAAPDAALEAALHGGEDHALLVTLPDGVRPPAELAGHRVHRIGRVEPLAAGDAPGVTLDGGAVEPRGWDPYRAVEL